MLSSPRKAVNRLAEPMLVDSCPLRVSAASLETFDAVVSMNAPLGVAVESSLLVGPILASWVAFAGVVRSFSGVGTGRFGPSLSTQLRMRSLLP